jgi:Cd2+-exporting ATPase
VEQKDGTQFPCESHLESARRRYGHILEVLGCICQALHAVNLESCCEGRKRNSEELTRPPKPNLRTRVFKNKSKATRSSQTSTQSPGSLKRINTGSTNSLEIKVTSADNCNGSMSKSCCSGGNCGKKPSTDSCSIVSEKGRVFDSVVDVEKGEGPRERIVVSVQGMTCTGCETKLSRSLSAIPGATDVSASLILARAEFDLNTALTSSLEAIARLERVTGFKCERIVNSGNAVEVKSLPYIEPLPPGVTETVVLSDGSLRLIYDAKIIGARDIVNKAFGEKLELAPPRADPSISAGREHLRNVFWAMVVSIILTIPVLVLAWAPLPENDLVYSSISLGLATLVQVFIAGPFYPAALKSLFYLRVLEMDLLIVLSTSAAYLFSVISFALARQGTPLSTGQFFETSTLLVTLIMVGRYVSALARQKAVESITIRSLQQATAMLVAKDGTATEIDARLLQYGDTFRILPDARAVTDGCVIAGSSDVDESLVTGESRAVAKAVDSTIIAGSVNGWGTLDVRATRLPDENTISTLATLVDEAKRSKAGIQDVADTVAGYFIPVVCFLTIVTFFAWLGVGIQRGQSGSEAAVQATTYAIAVLIISCPCAIGLAVPMVIVMAGGVAADQGVVFKTATTIEVAKDATHVVFDKTGTLTEGKPAVVHEVIMSADDVSLRRQILGLVSGSQHPVSQGLKAYLEADGVEPVNIRGITVVPAGGIQGVDGKAVIQVGNSRWLKIEEQVSAITARQDVTPQSDCTTVCVVVDKVLCAIFFLRDRLRPEAKHVVDTLRRRGIGISLVSGDNAGAVAAVSSELGITDAHSRFSPEGKQKYIHGIVSGSNSKSSKTLWRKLLRKDAMAPVIIFVGDGANDAPALAAATIGIHMSSSTSKTLDSAVSRSAADAVLVRSDLRGVLVLLDLSKAAMRRVVFNFSWSAVYNLFAILLAGGAFVAAGHGGVEVKIPAAFAGLGEIVSVVPVIIAAVLLRWVKVRV